MSNARAISMLNTYLEIGGQLHNYNGAQWYIKLADDYVAILDTGSSNNCTLEFMEGEKAKKYLKTSGNCTGKSFRDKITAFTDLVM